MTDLMFAYIYHIFWAVFLGYILSWGFWRSWKAEHGEIEGWRRKRGNTHISYDPLVFPIFIAFSVLLFGIFDRLVDGHQFLLNLGLDIFLFISLYFILLLLLLPFLRKYFTARTCATFWLIPVFLFYQPYAFYNVRITSPRFVFYIPEMLLQLLIWIWTAGFLLFIAAQIISHVRFAEKLKKHAYPVEEAKLTELWERLKDEMEIDFPIRLCYCSVIRTPLTIGMWKNKRITYLPEQRYSAEDAELIFSHELHHIQRNDTHTKFFLRFCNALGWIHPLVWIAVRKAEDDLELSCDEIVLYHAGPEKRRRYAELLLTTAEHSHGYTTCLSASARTLKYRMKETVSEKEKRKGIFLLFLVMAVSVLSVGIFAVSTDRQKTGDILRLHSSGIAEAGLLPDGIMSDGSLPDKNGEYYRKIEDVESLTQHLSDLKAERVIYRYDMLISTAEPVLCGKTEAGREFYIYDDYMEVEFPGHSRSVLYHLTEQPDWEYFRSLAQQ